MDISSSTQRLSGLSLKSLFCRLFQLAGTRSVGEPKQANATGSHDSEKAIFEAEGAPGPPNTGSTWDSQNDTIIPIEEEIVIEEDSDEESRTLLKSNVCGSNLTFCSSCTTVRITSSSIHEKHTSQKSRQAKTSTTSNENQEV